VSAALFALFSIAFLGINLVFVLRPGALPAPSSCRDAVESTAQTGLMGWARHHHATLLCLGRGTLNGGVAMFGLYRVGHPLAASIAEGLTAGVLSGSFQMTVLNERFSGYLNRASGELARILRWAWFQAIFYGLVKAAGTLAGGAPSTLTALGLAYVATITFGSAQYPWEAAIAARRIYKTEQGAHREGVCFIADLQTMAVSVTCVGVSILNSVGVAGSRMFLVLVGLLGLSYYGLVRVRRDRWRRTRAWSPVGDVTRAAALTVLVALALPGAAQAARRHRRRAPEVSQPVPPVTTELANVEIPQPEAAPLTITATPEAPAPRLDLPLATPGTALIFTTDEHTPRGYITIPGTRSSLRLSGFLKLDAIHDTGPYSGDASDLPNLVLRGDPGADQRTGLTHLHARESRLSLGTFTDTSAGPVMAYLEIDFFGNGGPNNYGLRMRHAYLTWRSLLAGYTYSNFLDTDARGTTIEFNGPTAAGNRKRAQVRLSHRLSDRFVAALAFENGAADYTDPTATPVTAADVVLPSGSSVVQQMPDLTAHLRYQASAGHLAARAMARQMRVLSPQGSVNSAFGYGLALSGRWQPHGRSNLFAQATAGRGLGGYVDDLDGQAATFDRTGQIFAPQVGYAALAGAEAYWSKHWRSNLIATVSGTVLPAFAPAGPDLRPISTRFAQVFANAIFAPTADLLIGLEYGYYRRDTNGPLVGWSHRLQLGILYRFGG
jgi:hypothetical protein